MRRFANELNAGAAPTRNVRSKTDRVKWVPWHIPTLRMEVTASRFGR